MAPLYKYIIDDFVLHYVFSYLVLSFYMLLFSAFYLCTEMYSSYNNHHYCICRTFFINLNAMSYYLLVFAVKCCMYLIDSLNPLVDCHS